MPQCPRCTLCHNSPFKCVYVSTVLGAYYCFNCHGGISEKLGEEKICWSYLWVRNLSRGPLSVPCRLGTPAYRFQDKTNSGTCIHTLPHALHVTPSFKAKTECIPLCVPGSIFTHKVTNSEINSITSVYYNIS
jgi:hypothetical protein